MEDRDRESCLLTLNLESELEAEKSNGRRLTGELIIAHQNLTRDNPVGVLQQEIIGLKKERVN